MKSNNPLLGKSEKELLEEYYNFVRTKTKVQTANTARKFEKFLKNDVAPKFITEGDKKVKQLFNCPISKIKEFRESCLTGENYEWNDNYKGNQPHQSLKYLIKFLEYHKGNPDTVTPDVREKENSEEELLEEYYNFVRPRVKWESTAASYRDVLRKNIAPKFIKEGDEKVRQLFNCTVSEIRALHESCLAGRENYEWNKNIGDRTPSGALSQLIDFLEYYKDNPDTATPVVREKEKSKEELLEEYYNFVRDKLKLTTSTAQRYTDFLENDIAPKFITEGNEKVKQLFNCPVSKIRAFHESCKKGGENYEWNWGYTGNHPSAALPPLIEFLEYHPVNPDTAIPVVREKEKSEEELLEEFRLYVHVQELPSVAEKCKSIIKKHIAPKFIKEGDEKVKQLFNCPVSKIKTFHKSCKKRGENYEWNQGIWNGWPRIILGHLKKFLENRGDNLKDVIPEAREKNEVFPKSVAPLNQIFYGPPGTGKTYNTTKHALDIIDGEEVNNKRADAKQKQRFTELQEQEEGQIAMVTFHQNFAYEDFIEGIKPVLEKNTGTVSYELEAGLFKSIAVRADKNRQKNFVLIIDEINRGNISKILGELITLIEPSKRLGNPDKLKLALPYSKDLFGVPKNLYIIGTMNTADRSLAPLDTALRRRFNFIEMMPDSNRIADKQPEGVKLKQLLEAMNERIAAIDSREHQIGHTYFMGVDKVDSLEKLKECFQQKVIPLLQEYFFDDWGKIQSVLNKNGFVRKVSKEDEEDNPIYDLLSYNDGGWNNPKNYIAIYQSQSSTDTTDEEE